jgi:hypothetical protein
MRYLVFVLACLLTSTALAETQTVKQARLRNALRATGMAGTYANQCLAGFANVYYYDTYVELAAATPTEGVFGWAIDTDAMYYYTGSAWTALLSASSAGLLGTNGGTIGNETNNVWTVAENGEDFTVTFAANSATFASGTGSLFTFTPATTFSGDVSFGGGAGALNLSGSGDSTMLVADADATAWCAGATGALDLVCLDTTDASPALDIKGVTTQVALHVDVGTAQFDEGFTSTGDIVLNGGAGGLNMSGSGDSTMLVADADATAWCAGATGALDLICLDTTDASPALDIKGVTTQVALHVDVGTVLIDEDLAVGGGAGALNVSSSGDASMLVADADSTAFCTGATGALDILCIDSTDASPGVVVKGLANQTSFAVSAGDATFAEDVTIGDGTAATDFSLTFNGEDSDGVCTWMEDEALFDFDHGLQIDGSSTIGDGTAATDFSLTFNGEDSDGVCTWMEDEALFDFDHGLQVDGSSTIGDGTAAADYTLTFNGEDNDGTITYMEDEDRFDFDNDVVVGNDLTVTADVTVATLDAAVPAIALHEIRFCGNGPNGNTTVYNGPILETDMDTDMTFGAAGCDANDSTTETNVDDAPIPFAYKPVAMACLLAAGGTDDTVTFQLREDQSDVTGLTCNVVMDGANAQQCVVRLAAPETVAAGSLIDVSMVATDDNLSAIDAECRVFVTF